MHHDYFLLSTDLNIYLSIYLFIYLSIRQSVRPSFPAGADPNTKEKRNQKKKDVYIHMFVILSRRFLTALFSPFKIRLDMADWRGKKKLIKNRKLMIFIPCEIHNNYTNKYLCQYRFICPLLLKYLR